MPFDTGDLEAPEVGIVAVEYLRELGRWLESAAAETSEGTVSGAEAMHVLREAGESIRDLAGPVENRIRERFGDRLPDDRAIRQRRVARSSIVPDEDAERSLADLLEVAASELEETYHFFLFEGEQHGDGWLRSLFDEIADELRGVLVFVEEEKESLLQTEG